MKIYLVPLHPSHAPQMYSLLSDPQVSRYLGLTLPDMKSTYRFFERVGEEEQNQTAYVRAIVNAQGKMIGSVMLANIDKDTKSAEIGIFLSRDVWGKGIHEVVHKEMLRYAFTEMNLETIFYCVEAKNTRAQHSLNKFPYIKRNVNNQYAWFAFRKWLQTGIRYQIHAAKRSDYIGYEAISRARD